MSEDSHTLAPGTVLARKFRVVRCLGEGGMGAVYEIEHELTKHRRALKLLHAEMAAVPSVVERLLREASAAGRVGNPHIVETFDAGVLDTGEPYLVMEILRGEPLSTRIAGGPMAVAEVVDLIAQSCAGVQAAHEAGIVHRDLKPDNLFVTDVEGRPFVKLLDFGISKFDPSKTGGLQLTQEGAALGTPYYMPPEQIRGEGSLDARADVYALGVILYECLAGKRPYDAETLTQLAILIHTGQPVPIAQLRPDLPQGFAEVVEHAMASDRTKRIQTAAELGFALERYGTVSFRTQAGAGGAAASIVQSRLAPPPGRGTSHARSLATSGVGVSMQPPPPAAKSPAAAILAGLATVGVLALGGGLAFWHHARAATSEATSEPPSPSVAPASPGLPPAAPSQGPAPATGDPQPSAATSSAPARPSVSPVIVEPPPLQAPAASASGAPAGSAKSALGSAPAHGAEHKAGRADERGLAKDNPFK